MGFTSVERHCHPLPASVVTQVWLWIRQHVCSFIHLSAALRTCWSCTAWACQCSLVTTLRHLILTRHRLCDNDARHPTACLGYLLALRASGNRTSTVRHSTMAFDSHPKFPADSPSPLLSLLAPAAAMSRSLPNSIIFSLTIICTPTDISLPACPQNIFLLPFITLGNISPLPNINTNNPPKELWTVPYSSRPGTHGSIPAACHPKDCGRTCGKGNVAGTAQELVIS